MIKKELTKSEEQVMQVIWKIEQGFANDIVSSFPEPKPAYNTILTIVRILERKGYISHESFGKIHRYYPLISKEEYSRNYLNGFVKKYFNDSYKSLVSFFADNNDISVEELDEIQALIKKVK